MKKNIKPIVLIVLAIFSITILSIFAFYFRDIKGSANGKDVTVEIKSGSYAAQIAEQLEKEGIVKSSFIFRIFSKYKGYDSKFNYGTYSFNTGDSYEKIAQKLINEGAKADTIKVTIPEGTGINDYIKNVNGENVTVLGIASILEKSGVCKKADFIDALKEVALESKLLKGAKNQNTYYTLEGYLFPETYEFYKIEDSKSAAKAVIEKMLAETEKRITDDMYKKAEKLGYSMHEILTMASIVQMETGINTKEMPMIAGIFYNRLNSKDFITLGSSPTSFYGNSFNNDDGRYNTDPRKENKNYAKGLPPGPLCSPGISAIKAALEPEVSSYYFFVTDKDGRFYYRKTLAEHNKIVSDLKNGNNWNYEYYN